MFQPLMKSLFISRCVSTVCINIYWPLLLKEKFWVGFINSLYFKILEWSGSVFLICSDVILLLLLMHCGNLLIQCLISAFILKSVFGLPILKNFKILNVTFFLYIWHLDLIKFINVSSFVVCIHFYSFIIYCQCIFFQIYFLLKTWLKWVLINYENSDYFPVVN